MATTTNTALTYENHVEQRDKAIAAVHAAVIAANAAMVEGDFSAYQAQQKIAKEQAKEANKHSGAIYAHDILGSGSDGFLKLASDGGFYPAISVSEGTDDDDRPQLKAENKLTAYNVFKLNSAYWAKICPNPAGMFMLQGLYVAITRDSATSLGMTANDFKSKIESGIAVKECKEDGIEIKKLEISRTKFLAVLREVVAALLGDEWEKKVTSHDVRWIQAGIEKCSVKKKDDKLRCTVIACSQKDFAALIVGMCNRILTNGGYDFACKGVKKAK